MHPARNGYIRADLSVKDCDPVKTQEQFTRMAKRQAWDNFKLFDVRIGLVEAIEDHQGIRASGVQQAGGVRDSAKKMRDFQSAATARLESVPSRRVSISRSLLRILATTATLE